MESLAIAGFGKLGSAIARGAIDAGMMRAQDIVVWARSEARRAQARAWGLSLADWPDLAGRAPRLLLALKPQVFAGMTDPRPALAQDAVVISVMGGWSAIDIGRRLGTRRVIRAMPNVAASVGASVTALASDAQAAPEAMAFAQRLFAAVGKVVAMPESDFDTATAVGASGVGFACLFVEALEQAAQQAGMDAAAAREMAVGAISGAASCLRTGQVSPDELRRQVTSPAGTTAAGLQTLEDGQLAQLVQRAVDAARARASELGRTSA
jgi:pyrroline-5-carboxylate reductase